MSETPAGDENATPTAGGEETMPSMRVVAQYLKDLSFENPNAPAVYSEMNAQPKIDVNVDVSGRGVGTDHYEVELSISARATHEDKPVFVVESTYAGIFHITNVPQEHMEQVMVSECPHLLFPFLRQIVADATRNGNFPPMMIDPIDFRAMYEKRAAQERVAQAGTA